MKIHIEDLEHIKEASFIQKYELISKFINAHEVPQ